MRDMINLTFEQAGFHPKISSESTSILVIVNMVKDQICPALFLQSYTEANIPIAYLSVSPRQNWMRYMAHLRDTYPTRPERTLLRLYTLCIQGKLLMQEGEGQVWFAQTQSVFLSAET